MSILLFLIIALLLGATFAMFFEAGRKVGLANGRRGKGGDLINPLCGRTIYKNLINRCGAVG